MRVLVCGSRHWTDGQRIWCVLATLPAETVIIEGEAPGADKRARAAAERLGMEVKPFPADWEKHEDCRCSMTATYCKMAGFRRNQKMLDEGKPDRVLAFTLNLEESHGTRDMVTRARKAGVPVEVIGEEPEE